ncbi:hypothetical protein CTE07_03580 [Chitinophaga terrae (ex Kim and Jung 2007)]|nr:hypothetical protein CTE07_03580 [Chitinophaga terrae (ex Kim and Jung 2007)]
MVLDGEAINAVSVKATAGSHVRTKLILLAVYGGGSLTGLAGTGLETTGIFCALTVSYSAKINIVTIIVRMYEFNMLLNFKG